MAPRAAWALCNEPGGERGIQNIRKRGFAVRERHFLVQPEEPEVPVATPAQALTSNERRKEVFRLKSDQVKKMQALEHLRKQKFDEVYAAATKKWAEMVSKGENGKGEDCADAVAARFAAELPEGCTRKLTGRSLKHALQQDRTGRAPARRNRDPAIPAAFVQSISQFAQMKQINGDEMKPRQLVQAAVASVDGTAYQHRLSSQAQKQYLLKRVRKEMELAVATSKVIDNRRWLWLTSTNLKTWFEGYVKSLAEWKFIPGVPENAFEVITIVENKLPYLANGDESHQKLSNEGEQAGPSMTHGGLFCDGGTFWAPWRSVEGGLSASIP